MKKLWAIAPLSLAPFLASAGSPDWAPCSIAPLSLAQKTDNELHSLTHTSADYVYKFKLVAGIGRVVGTANIKTQNQFRLAMPLVGATDNEKDAIKLLSLIASNGKLATYTVVPKLAKSSIEPFPGKRDFPAHVIDHWMRDNVRILFTAVGSKNNPLEALVKDVQADPRYRVETDVRTISMPIPPRAQDDPYKVNQGQPQARSVDIEQYRLLIKRSPDMEKKYGQLSYEVVIDSKYYLPMSMNNIVKSGRMSYNTAMYQTRWNLHASTFPDRCFDIKTATIESRPLSF